MTKEKTPPGKNKVAGNASSQSMPTGAQDLRHITTGFNTLSKCRHGWMLYHGADQYIGRGLKKYG